jgi:hypothetical protein
MGYGDASKLLQSIKEDWRGGKRGKVVFEILSMLVVFGVFIVGAVNSVRSLFELAQPTLTEPVMRETYVVSSNQQQGGVTVGKIEVVEDNKARHLTPEFERLLLEEIDKNEVEHKAPFKYVVVSASPNTESQAFAQEIINFLIRVKRWHIPQMPMTVLSRTPISAGSDVVFNVSPNYDQYPSAIELIVLDQ